MAIVVVVLVAVAGWLVNAFFARRAIRRNMRIEYLLSGDRSWAVWEERGAAVATSVRATDWRGGPG